MVKKYKITRRDFMNGVAWGAVAGAALSPLEVMARFGSDLIGKNYYPPKLTGMRGDHVGSFEVAHGVSWQGESWPRPQKQTDGTYDLVIVGGGISGLAAAWLYREQAGAEVKILVLDNHDDFGGAAKRNEFTVDGQKLIGYGGSMTIEGPAHYSKAAKKLLRDLAIDVQRFYTYFDEGFNKKWGLGSSIFFNKENYGVDRLVPDPFSSSYAPGSNIPEKELVARFPLSEETRSALSSLAEGGIDYLPDVPLGEKPKILKKISYVDFLNQYAKIPKAGTDFIRDKWKSVWALGWDALSALEAARLEMPGTFDMGLTYEQLGWEVEEEPYIFHFPDGNAGIARALVRGLIPGSIPGSTMEDLVTARANYGDLDLDKNKVRIRLNSTAVEVRHTGDEQAVDVTYVQEGKAKRVRGNHVILACNNRMIPYICPEVPEKQVEAIEYATRAPLVYINVALRNWRAFEKAKTNRIYIPEAKMAHSFSLDFPVSMGSYHFSKNPDEPIVIHGVYIPNVPGEGLNGREQFVLGRQKVYRLSFADFEEDVYRQMNGALGPYGFDGGRDIAAITVNRWPHGYAYEYNELFDPVDWNPKHGPHIAGRAQIGRISIANSDASAYAYVDGAIDAAARAVAEQVALG